LIVTCVAYEKAWSLSAAPSLTVTFPFTTTAPPKKQLPVTVLEYVRPGIAPWSQV
jgi:hypothetical protein